MKTPAIILFLTALAVVEAHGLADATTAPGPTRASVALELSGRATSGSRQSGGFGGATVEGSLHHRFGETFSGTARVAVQSETGSFKDPYADENRPGTRAAVREASLLWTPWEPVDFKAGVLPHDDTDTVPLFVSQSFPGLRSEGRGALDRFRIGLSAEQSLASSALGTSEPTARGGRVPLLFRETVTAGYRPGDAVDISLHGSHFSFRDLSEDCAHRSRFYGNGVAGQSPSVATFQYAFRGFEGGLALTVRPTASVAGKVFAGYLRNTAAPSGRNAAFVVGAEAPLRLSSKISLVPRFELFSREADASPAVFVARDWGRANRRGYGLGLRAIYGEGISADLRYVSGKVISSSPYQGDTDYVVFTLRLDHDVL